MTKFTGIVTTKVTKTIEADSAEAATEQLKTAGDVAEGTESVEVTDVAEATA